MKDGLHLVEGSGFQGVEGSFRLTQDSVAERDYAIIGFAGGGLAVVEPAPSPSGS